jgi:hypothetical protein
VHVHINFCHTPFALGFKAPLVPGRINVSLFANPAFFFSVVVDNRHPRILWGVHLTDRESHITSILIQNFNGSNLVVVVLVNNRDTVYLADLLGEN